jgi:hypothetical protein
MGLFSVSENIILTKDKIIDNIQKCYYHINMLHSQTHKS